MLEIIIRFSETLFTFCDHAVKTATTSWLKVPYSAYLAATLRIKCALAVKDKNPSVKEALTHHISAPHEYCRTKQSCS